MPTSMYAQRLRLNRTPSNVGTSWGGRSASSARPSQGRSPDHVEILELQREAGNRAVARLIAVQRDKERHTPEGSGAKLAESPPTFKELGPPPPLRANEEESYRSQGEAKLADLGGPAAASSAGHTTASGSIDGFPDWFSNLQNTLVESKEWRKDKEEIGQNLLADYALRRFAVKFQGDTTKVPPTVRIFMQHVGRSSGNQKVAEAAGLPSSKKLGGEAGAKNWCAQAGSSSVMLAMAAAGLTVDDKTTWAKWLNYPPVPHLGLPGASVEAKIEIGDQVSYVEAALLAKGGHTVTALSSSRGEGTVFEHVSGNAGGGGSGSVRIGSSKPRGKVPGHLTFTDFQNNAGADPALGTPPGVMWAYIIVKYSSLWADLGAIDTTVPNVWQSKEGQAFLAKYQLKVAPVKA